MLKTIINIPSMILDFFKNTWLELKQVDYLSRSKTIKYTLFILVFLVIGTLFILAIDRVFIEIRNLLLNI